MKSFQHYLAPVAIAAIVVGFSSYGLVSDNNPGSQKTPVGNLSPEPATEASSSTGVVPTNTSLPKITVPTEETQPGTKVGKVALKATVSQGSNNSNRANPVILNVYRADSQCQSLVSEQVAVPVGNPVNTVIGKVLETGNSSDFNVSGYRVKINANTGVATVDLRLSPDSQRQFVSLSTCEQFALFGSLRKTLTANSQLNIKDVRFTEQGEDIYL
ncbi:hypothetical protein [Moorena bouillonii]|uniref:Sporulation/spore germination protein n=1 Tax=Moorena bouillonii PNG TaxID=568701 RepID=A0A1U7MWG1_9CYAN|nr:hypothetical protein [Moorena bouillonii]OLT58048.1 hypothetical protein BJP37_02325 [Moorena bouillonii PNG]